MKAAFATGGIALLGQGNQLGWAFVAVALAAPIEESPDN